jgi:alkylation response protein AidB-like acyl-CoA dehydrogenase
MISFGLLHEEVGRGCSSLRSLLTVHSMVSYAVLRWGSSRLKDTWLPQLAQGGAIAAFALSEPKVGSDARSVETTATRAGDAYVLHGEKRWITFGQIADIFLVFARCADQPTAFLVERNNPGVRVEPIHGMLGTRASMLAALHFEDCIVPRANMVGGVGFGFAAVGTSALDLGRFSVASGCVGIGQACLEACSRYTSERRQFGAHLREHQLIRQMVTDMVTNVKAARLLCHHAAYLREIGDPCAGAETFVAKYFASTMATKVARDAVQIHGAYGCSPDSPVQRYLRDATVMEIIEGSTQIQQITIAEQAYSGTAGNTLPSEHAARQSPLAVGG